MGMIWVRVGREKRAILLSPKFNDWVTVIISKVFQFLPFTYFLLSDAIILLLDTRRVHSHDVQDCSLKPSLLSHSDQ